MWRQARAALVVTIVLAGCSGGGASPPPTASAPAPTARGSSSAAPTATPAPPTPVPEPSASLPPMVRVSFPNYEGEVPEGWTVTEVPTTDAADPTALFYLSNVALASTPCPRDDQLGAGPAACPRPVPALPAGGVIIAVSPPHEDILIGPTAPPAIWGPPAAWCSAIGGEEGAIGVIRTWDRVEVCLKGPSLPAVEALARAIVATLRYVS